MTPPTIIVGIYTNSAVSRVAHSLTLRGLLSRSPCRRVASQKSSQKGSQEGSLRSDESEIRPGVGARPGIVIKEGRGSTVLGFPSTELRNTLQSSCDTMSNEHHVKAGATTLAKYNRLPMAPHSIVPPWRPLLRNRPRCASNFRVREQCWGSFPGRCL
eukprot:1185565-Prorocentrum_minimum.AAC.2